MHRTMRQHPRRALLLLGVLAASAQAAIAQLLPPLQPFEPLQPMQPFKPFAPLPPMQPMPGFPPFPAFPQMQMPAFPTMGAFGGAAAAGRAGGPGVYSSSSSSSFGGPRASTTPGCTVVQETSGESMGSSSNAGQSSCRLSQRVEICKSDKPGAKGHTRAVASVNGQEATCCVVLLKLPAKTPQLFCAAPTRSPNFLRMPAADTAVVMKPECSSSTATGRTVGSVSCTVTFSQLPEGFTYPEGYTAASPLVLHRGSGSKAFTASNSSSGAFTGPSTGRSGFVPCNNKQFRKFVQATSRPLPNGGVILTSKCD